MESCFVFEFLKALKQQKKIVETAHSNLVRNSQSLSCIGLQTSEDINRFNITKKHLEERGIKFVESDQFEPGKEISRKALCSIVRWKPKFLKEAAKCIERVREYIENKEKCIMFYKMSDQCIHQNFNHSVIQCMKHIYQTLQYPRIYAPFKFEIHSIPQFLDWMDELDKNQYYPFCISCINVFWSNQQLIDLFLNYSAKLGFSTCKLQTEFYQILMAAAKKFNGQFELIQDFYIKKLRPPTFKDEYSTELDEKCIFNIMEKFFILVEITDIWHRLMIHPQFIRYHLFQNMKLFQMFLKYWHAMRAIDFDINNSRLAIDEHGVNYEIFDIIRKYMQYLLEKYNDISYCFYSMMKYLKKKHLRYKYIGDYINTIEGRIAAINISDTDNYQCLLNLIWKKLTYKYKQYNVDITQFVTCNLIMLPLDEHDDANMDDLIRRKLRFKIKCANSMECRNENNVKLCARCKMVYYCSRHCQKKNWKKVHRFVCCKIERNFDKLTFI